MPGLACSRAASAPSSRVQMMRGDEPGYSRPDRYVLDDWR
jgi:hypothetical protein